MVFIAENEVKIEEVGLSEDIKEEPINRFNRPIFEEKNKPSALSLLRKYSKYGSSSGEITSNKPIVIGQIRKRRNLNSSNLFWGPNGPPTRKKLCPPTFNAFRKPKVLDNTDGFFCPNSLSDSVKKDQNNETPEFTNEKIFDVVEKEQSNQIQIIQKSNPEPEPENDVIKITPIDDVISETDADISGGTGEVAITAKSVDDVIIHTVDDVVDSAQSEGFFLRESGQKSPSDKSKELSSKDKRTKKRINKNKHLDDVIGHDVISHESESFFLGETEIPEDTKTFVEEIILEDTGNSENTAQELEINTKEENMTYLTETDRDVYTCGICSLRVKDLKLHMNKHHPEGLIQEPGNKPLSCERCGRRYSSYKGLTLHRFNVHGDRFPYKCGLCDASFKEHSHLKYHLKEHRGDNKTEWPCEICGKNFSTKHSLRTHLSNVCKSEGRPWQCEYCDSSFKCQSHLRIHVMRHMGTKPFACDICDMRFLNRQKLTRHQIVHKKFENNEKEYNCLKCKRGYMTKAALEKHRKRMHSQPKKSSAGKLQQFRNYNNSITPVIPNIEGDENFNEENESESEAQSASSESESD